MTAESARQNSSEEEDRVVSRRVDNPTAATEEDERAYDAADPLPDSGPEDSYRGATGGVSESTDGDTDGDSEPTRSE
jgi:hypothetical protein